MINTGVSYTGSGYTFQWWNVLDFTRNADLVLVLEVSICLNINILHSAGPFHHKSMFACFISIILSIVILFMFALQLSVFECLKKHYKNPKYYYYYYYVIDGVRAL